MGYGYLVAGMIGMAIGMFIIIALNILDKPKSKRLVKKYRILEICYYDNTKTKESSRFLWSQEYYSWDAAMKAAEKKLAEDTLRNIFNYEYIAVEAP